MKKRGFFALVFLAVFLFPSYAQNEEVTARILSAENISFRDSGFSAWENYLKYGYTQYPDTPINYRLVNNTEKSIEVRVYFGYEDPKGDYTIIGDFIMPLNAGETYYGRYLAEKCFFKPDIHALVENYVIGNSPRREPQ